MMLKKLTIFRTLSSFWVFPIIYLIILPFYFGQSRIIGFDFIGPGLLMPTSVAFLFSFLIRELFKQKIINQAFLDKSTQQELDNILVKLAIESLKTNDLDKFLKKAIEAITEFENIYESAPRIALFLRKPDTAMYELKVHSNLSPHLIKKCSTIFESKGICGEVIKSKKMKFGYCSVRENLTDQSFEENVRVYSLPILSSNNDVIGLLTMYLDKDEEESPLIKNFLLNVASVLGSILYQFDLKNTLSRKAQENEKSNKILISVFDNIPQGVFWLDPSLQILGGNKKFMSDIRVVSGEKRLKKNFHISELLSQTGDANLNEKLLQVAINTKQPLYNIRRTLKYADDTIQMRLNIVPIQNELGKVQMITVTYEDITEKMMYDEQLNRMNEELLIRNDEIKRYAEITSHNLRSPLTNILGLIELIQNPEIGEKERNEFIKGLEDSARQIDAIYTNLIDNLKIKRKLNIALKNLDMNSIFRNTITKLEAAIEETGAQVSGNFEKGSGRLRSFEPFIENILYNLLANAIKFKHPDRPCVIKVVTDIDDQNFMIHVEDNGLGIPAKSLSKVFDFQSRFHDIQAGQGLGLYYSNIQAQTLGGKITVTSEEGKGSVFTLSLPLAKEQPVAAG